MYKRHQSIRQKGDQTTTELAQENQQCKEEGREEK